MVLRFHRELPRLEALHAEGQWHRFLPVDERKHAVGIMGYGSIGAPIAEALMQLGFPVRVWTRQPRRSTASKTFAGRDGFAPFLAGSAILVCALPLTPRTAGLLGAPQFSALPRGAFVINVSRGALFAKDELLAAVDSGHLAGAALDVFETSRCPPQVRSGGTRRSCARRTLRAMPRPDVAAKHFLENLRRAPRRPRAPECRRSQSRLLACNRIPPPESRHDTRRAVARSGDLAALDRRVASQPARLEEARDREHPRQHRRSPAVHAGARLRHRRVHSPRCRA
jgi:glyoxylate/hydroxypyruvate reductase A